GTKLLHPNFEVRRPPARPLRACRQARLGSTLVALRHRPTRDVATSQLERHPRRSLPPRNRTNPPPESASIPPTPGYATPLHNPAKSDNNRPGRRSSQHHPTQHLLQ